MQGAAFGHQQRPFRPAKAPHGHPGVPYGLPAGDTDSDGDFDSADVAAITGSYDVRKDANLDGTIDVFDVLHASNMTGSAGTVTTGRDVLGSPDNGNRFGYAAYLRDPAVPQWHVRHRVFRSDIGRWLTRDPAGYVDGWNLYQYVGSSALSYVDPSGLNKYEARRQCERDCSRQHGGYRGYTRTREYKACVKSCRDRHRWKENWVKSPEDIGGIPGKTFCSWDNAFRWLGCMVGDSNIAVISCHANAKDDPYFVDENGVMHHLGDPETWPQEWVDAIQKYEELILYCCYIGETDYPQRVANRVGRPVRAPGEGLFFPGDGTGEVIRPSLDPRYPGHRYYVPGRDDHRNQTWPQDNPYGPYQ